MRGKREKKKAVSGCPGLCPATVAEGRGEGETGPAGLSSVLPYEPKEGKREERTPVTIRIGGNSGSVPARREKKKEGGDARSQPPGANDIEAYRVEKEERKRKKGKRDMQRVCSTSIELRKERGGGGGRVFCGRERPGRGRGGTIGARPEA